jgi:hypothetical protein
LHLERSRLVLEPGDTAVVHFTVLLPRSTSSGQYLGGISVERDVRAITTAPSSSRTSAGVAVRTRRIVAVQAIVPGAMQAELRIDGVTAVPRPDGMQLAIQLHNSGNVLLRGHGRMTIDGEDGLTRAFNIDTFVPKTRIRYPIRWTDDPREGSFPSSVEIEYEGKVVRWDGDVQVTDQELRDYVDRTGSDRVPTDRNPYLLIALAAMLLLPVGWVVARARRARPSWDEHDWIID